MLNMAQITKIQNLKDQVVRQFDTGDWLMLESYLGNTGTAISDHPRLLRSLRFGDEDYNACVGEIIGQLLRAEPQSFEVITSMLKDKGAEAFSVDGGGKGDDYTVFSSEVEIDTSLISVMVPFNPSFQDVRDSMNEACKSLGFTLRAADDVWVSSVLIKDIFSLINRSCIVIVDFTGKNPNVMYETGVAHALRKEVIPVSQNINDVPFDLKHHRILQYDNNTEGRKALQAGLTKRIQTIAGKHNWAPLPF